MAKRPQSQPWNNGRKVTFQFHQDGTASLRGESKGDNQAALFDPSQASELQALWAEIQKLGRAFRSSSLWLRSAEKDDAGRYIGIPAELTDTYKDKESGEEKERSFAYVQEQLEEFEPKAFALKARWTGFALVPVLHCYADTDGRAATSGSFTRTIGVNRKQENGKAAEQPTYSRSK